ncbi:LysR family transcriptional regulator [Lewinella sp. W8]|uniref:LysR family transcriptional regulator n=1 Tax=Lewinella sp. W8 TaxID=2528208 RepID=UPI0010678074|nr:LysR family transcriptional regulator [Lewinella sp. W8]MTB50719.1 LysR family transcriptional regulator [Lewinella sp. W8]
MDYQIELRQIRSFLVLADELHFRRAADLLYMSQPGLSRQIRQLEDALGFPLFRRHNRMVELTSAGAFLRQSLGQQMADLELALDRAQRIHDGQGGELRFGYVGSAMQDIIPDLLLRFRADHPEVSYGLEALNNREQLDKLERGTLDIGFVRTKRQSPGLVSKAVAEDTFSLVLPPGHFVNQDNFQSLAQVREEPFILFDPNYSRTYYEQVIQLFIDAGFQPRVAHRTVHATTIYRLVENGFGLSIVPTVLGRGYRTSVQFVELTQVPQRTTLYAVWRRDNDNPALKRFTELL